ncbi:phosphoesterase PA-phosphatase [Actinobacteria bacterium YIM 96077]|uniref:Phosphoesterase PA-phosphatase n=1 Tax=Phytoactinopolyspora halophila TaxID=1981511 RepID=A0A329QLM9_9ACTN|nr:phosphatase PAP2 family protein [Phytoactinopolyspora halophila]AYY13003.1 phosphoesterase PA-phosphatase [Actinobacteria bacterium YIM 96077]RAW13267.1 phosphoesterase PA-phosphatase [Phytoactinopolyspora halophila]
MSRVDTAPARSERFATVLTTVFAPAHLVIGVLPIIGAASDTSAIRGLGWGTLAALLVGVLPYTWVLYAVRRGRFSSPHIPDRAQRLLPLAVAAAAAAGGLLTLAILGAPQQLIALLVAMLTGLVVTTTITLRWKISIHTAVAAGTATILTIVFGPALTASAIIAVTTGWSRIRLRDHTTAQVLAGAILGTIIAATVFIALR